ncbi:Engulfment and cell motility protein 1 [Trichinella zimbabwensis]|uniref:Engulfment and cell motility protein 1 n=2 Tax=Trichinella TaxID=6333 RepID=A0A0V1M5E3_9BILA|nr:Engulfment and cell motility protein 1 [Trichinella zimbabwensis]KRZ67083.1 Engulfment and cell motility protein 1 [Trichinella papuae]
MRRSSEGTSGSSTFFAKALSPYYPSRSDNILKVGVELSPDIAAFSDIEVFDKLPQLIEVNQNEPIDVIQKELCNRWDLAAIEDYALKYTVRSTAYLTEQNRRELVNGDILNLTFSPAKLSDIFLLWLTSSSIEDQTRAVTYLSPVVSDSFFSAEFIRKGGLHTLMDLIENNTFNDMPLSQLLFTFQGVIAWSEKGWELPSENLLIQISGIVVGRTKYEHPRVLSVAMSILEDIINSSSRAALIRQEVPFESLVRHLENSDSIVQQNVLLLMNAMFSKSVPPMRFQIGKLLYSSPVRNALTNNILRNNVGPELAHQLHVLQQLMLNLLDVKARTPILPGTTHEEQLHEFCKVISEKLGNSFSPSSTRKSALSNSMYGQKLGFKHPNDLVEDFQSPPGLLALHCILYFHKVHFEASFKIILENAHRTDGRGCPYIQTCIALVNTLMEVLHIGELPSDQSEVYYEMLFTEEHPFEEMFCRCAVLLNKTWKEMRATSADDVSKVIAVVKEQITRSLLKAPRTFQDFDKQLKMHNYAEISEFWERERSMKEENDFQTPQIQELRSLLKTDIISMVMKNRLSALKIGTVFAKYSRGSKGHREKGKSWSWRLCPTEKFLIYTMCQEKAVSSSDEMEWKLPISEISHVILGSDCTHIKETRGKKAGDVYAFSLVLTNDKAMKDSYNFVAPDVHTYNIWCDGLMILLGNEMVSPEFKQEFDLWLNIEIRLRLLELESVDVSSEVPAVPQESPDFDNIT